MKMALFIGLVYAITVEGIVRLPLLVIPWTRGDNPKSPLLLWWANQAGLIGIWVDSNRR